MDLIVCATQRCGSTMILEDLRNSRVFGVPEEYFIPWYGEITNVSDSLKSIISRATGPNGISSVKVMADQLKFIDHKLPSIDVSKEHSFFPNFARFFKEASWVYVKRNDVLRQAISRHMATETRINHATSTENDCHFAGNLLKNYNTDYNKDARYDFGKIKSHCTNIVIENISWENFFRVNKISPLVLIYEEYILNSKFEHLSAISELINVNFDFNKTPRRKMVKLSNSLNEDWYFRFLGDLSNFKRC